ncbi:MAG: hypothetical protein ACI4A5_08905 [Hominilimicola sp.]
MKEIMLKEDIATYIQNEIKQIENAKIEDITSVEDKLFNSGYKCGQLCALEKLLTHLN